MAAPLTYRPADPHPGHGLARLPPSRAVEASPAGPPSGVGPPLSFDPKDPRAMIAGEYGRAVDWFNRWDASLADLPYQELEEMYRAGSDAAWQELQRRGFGYTPEEFENIVREQEIRDLQLTPEEAGAAYLTPEEWAAIEGDPARAWEYYQPEVLRSLDTESQERLRQILGVSRESMDEVLSTMTGRYYGAIPVDKLGLTARFQEKFPVTDEEVAKMVEGAARDVRMRYQTAIDDMVRRAAAAGNVSPMAVAAGRARLESQAAADAADAMNSALVRARREQRMAEAGLEEMRLGTERDISGRLIGAARELGEAGLGTERFLTGAGLGTEENIANRSMRLGEFLQTTGMEQARWQDETEVRRAMMLGMNRQEAERYVQGQRYGRGLQATELLSRRYQTAADARRQEETAFRQYLQQQEQYYGKQFDQATQNRLRGAGISFDAAGKMVDSAANYDLMRRYFPQLWERIAGAVIGALPSAVDLIRRRRRRPPRGAPPEDGGTQPTGRAPAPSGGQTPPSTTLEEPPPYFDPYDYEPAPYEFPEGPTDIDVGGHQGPDAYELPGYEQPEMPPYEDVTSTWEPLPPGSPDPWEGPSIEPDNEFDYEIPWNYDFGTSEGPSWTGGDYGYWGPYDGNNQPPDELPYGWFAHGGIITRPTLAVVGEAGPEAIIPLANPRISTDDSYVAAQRERVRRQPRRRRRFFDVSDRVNPTSESTTRYLD